MKESVWWQGFVEIISSCSGLMYCWWKNSQVASRLSSNSISGMGFSHMNYRAIKANKSHPAPIWFRWVCQVDSPFVIRLVRSYKDSVFGLVGLTCCWKKSGRRFNSAHGMILSQNGWMSPEKWVLFDEDPFLLKWPPFFGGLLSFRGGLIKGWNIKVPTTTGYLSRPDFKRYCTMGVTSKKVAFFFQSSLRNHQ